MKFRDDHQIKATGNSSGHIRIQAEKILEQYPRTRFCFYWLH